MELGLLLSMWAAPLRFPPPVRPAPIYEFRTMQRRPAGVICWKQWKQFSNPRHCDSGSRSTYIDYLCIRVTIKGDAVTEPWYTTFKNSDGTTKTVNIGLGSGVVESAPIDDEQGKVHLNYASQSLLSYLMLPAALLMPPQIPLQPIL